MTPCRRKMACRPREEMRWGTSLIQMKSIVNLQGKSSRGGGGRLHLTTWARQEPRDLCSGVNTSPTMVYGTAPTPIP